MDSTQGALLASPEAPMDESVATNATVELVPYPGIPLPPRSEGFREYRDLRKAPSKKCTQEGCNKQSKQGGVCVAHGAVRRKCKHDGCENQCQAAGLCLRHGAPRKRCTKEGCEKYAVKDELCLGHGAKVASCSHEGCTNRARAGGICIRHGSVRKVCTHDGCGSHARKGGVCRRHGTALQQCTYPNCKNFTTVEGPGLCKRHSNGKVPKKRGSGPPDLPVHDLLSDQSPPAPEGREEGEGSGDRQAKRLKVDRGEGGMFGCNVQEELPQQEAASVQEAFEGNNQGHEGASSGSGAMDVVVNLEDDDETEADEPSTFVRMTLTARQQEQMRQAGEGGGGEVGKDSKDGGQGGISGLPVAKVDRVVPISPSVSPFRALEGDATSVLASLEGEAEMTTEGHEFEGGGETEGMWTQEGEARDGVEMVESVEDDVKESNDDVSKGPEDGVKASADDARAPKGDVKASVGNDDDCDDVDDSEMSSMEVHDMTEDEDDGDDDYGEGSGGGDVGMEVEKPEADSEETGRVEADRDGKEARDGEEGDRDTSAVLSPLDDDAGTSDDDEEEELSYEAKRTRASRFTQGPLVSALAASMACANVEVDTHMRACVGSDAGAGTAEEGQGEGGGVWGSMRQLARKFVRRLSG